MTYVKQKIFYNLLSKQIILSIYLQIIIHDKLLASCFEDNYKLTLTKSIKFMNSLINLSEYRIHFYVIV